MERRPIDRSELYIADELRLTGTLAEITPVRSIDEPQTVDASSQGVARCSSRRVRRTTRFARGPRGARSKDAFQPPSGAQRFLYSPESAPPMSRYA